MPTTAPGYHVPVLLNESINGLNIRPDGIYADMTFGGGGHSRALLERLAAEGHLYGFDQDADAEANIPSGDGRFTFVRSNFRFLSNWMDYYGVEALDGVLADLGVSSHHFDDEERGFSFRFDAPLDMRMNERGGQTAADILNTYEEEKLASTLYLYGELKNSRRIAAALVKARAIAPFDTAARLIEVVEPFVSKSKEKKDLARIFQALRMEVNHELDALQYMLSSAMALLKPGGRLVVLTYHSLEDRMVKNFMKAGNISGKVETDFYGNRLAPLKLVNNKVIVPSPEEQERNPRSRSAKLRIAEKVEPKAKSL